MKNAIVIFIEKHPIMAFLLVTHVASATRDTFVGVARAITGKYPPEKPKPEATELPKIDISVTKPTEESEEDSVLTNDLIEEVTGEVLVD